MHARLSRLRLANRRSAVRGLTRVAEHVLQVANTEVPFESGALARSGKTSVDEVRLVAAVSYDTPYAVVQHEDLTYQNDPGRNAKWLERALLTQRAVIALIIAEEARLRR